MSIQGGLLYPDDPQTILLTENSIINYGYLNGARHLLLEKMEEDLGTYVHESINTCLKDFSDFKKEGITFIKKNDQDITTSIEDDQVLVRLSYSGEFTKGDDVLRIDTYSAKIPLHLGRLFKEAKEVIDKQQENPSHLDLFTSPDYFLSYHPFDEKTIIYSLSDEKSLFDGAPLTFMFAVRNENINSPPSLDFIPDFTIRKGNTLTYELSASDPDDDLLTFTTDNSLIAIDEEDVLTFTSPTTGIFSTTLIVLDSQGEKDEQTFKITVKE